MRQVHTGVLLSAHGTVQRYEDIPAFLNKIRHGRPTPPEIINEVQRRFQHIGGSPLLRITQAQAQALQTRLGLPVVVGMRLWSPSFVEALEALEAYGVQCVISLPLAPQSVHIYHAALGEACEERKRAGKYVPAVVEVPPWGLEQKLLQAWDESLEEGLSQFHPNQRAPVAVVLSAHSLPLRVIASGDPYETQFRHMAEALIAYRNEPEKRFRVAFQSQGMDGGAWLGPDLPTTLRELHDEGVDKALIAAIGFVADHVETLYDLDVEAKRIASALGIHLERAPSMNTRSRFIDALEATVRKVL